MSPSNSGPPSEREDSSSTDNATLLFYSAMTSPQRSIGLTNEPIPLVQSSSDPKTSLVLPLKGPYASLKSPMQFRNMEQMIWEARSYCSLYIDSQEVKEHLEPTIHHFTFHGQFGHEMQDGISVILHQDNGTLASGYFDTAFDKLEDLLKDNHPMSFAQLHAVICELTARAATSGRSATC